MKHFAENSLLRFTETYAAAVANSRHTKTAEALSLGVDVSTGHNYLSEDCDRQLPAALVPHSLVKGELIEYLAKECGGVFIPVSGELNGTTQDELEKIIKHAGSLVNETNDANRRALFRKIEQLAARAAEELKK